MKLTKKIEIDIECKYCAGTGLYVGMAEREGAAVICYQCNGTGKYKYQFVYKKFIKRVARTDIKRVYQRSSYCLAPKIINFKDVGEIDLAKEGVSYEEFCNGAKPQPIKKLECPMTQDQGACHGIPGFIDKCNELHGGWLNVLSNCKHQSRKAECWERFENSIGGKS